MKHSRGLIYVSGLGVFFGLALLAVQHDTSRVTPFVKAQYHRIHRPIARAVATMKWSTEEVQKGCGANYQAIGKDQCLPLDTETGKAYSVEEWKEFESILASPFVGKGNVFVPQIFSVAELEAQRRELEEMKVYRSKILDRIATEAEIDSFYRFRSSLFAQRLQLVHYMFVERGGTLSEHDPNLDPQLIHDETVLAVHTRLRNEQAEDYEQQKRARKENGFKSENFLF